MKITRLFRRWGLIAAIVCGGFFASATTSKAAAIPDFSSYQGQFTASQAQKLKSQTSFVIQKATEGTYYYFSGGANNITLYKKYGIKFAQYHFARFSSVAEAKQEATYFYNHADKNALFYVLDYETVDSTNTSSSYTNQMVNAWYTQMRKLTSKKLVFYSYSSFATAHANSARQKFDAQWIASYGSTPTIAYDLWQYTDSYYLSAIGKYVDNSKVNTSKHSLSWWLNGLKNPSSSSSSSSTTTAKSNWQAGQTVYLNANATNYYDRSKIATSVRKQNYVILSTKTIAKKSRSTQAVYLAGLNQWVLSQDISTASGKIATNYQTTASSGVNYWLTNAATNYYSGGAIASSARQKNYAATSVKTISKSHSTQALYMANLRNWVLAQDVVGYYTDSYNYYIAKTNVPVFTTKYMGATTGKAISANSAFTASVISLGNNIVRLQTSSGYVTADSRFVEPRYYTTTGTNGYLTINRGKTVYVYKDASFKAAARYYKADANTKYYVKRVVKASNGSYYFQLTNGYYMTGDKLQVSLH